MVANFALGHEVRPRIRLPDLLRETLHGWLSSFASWFLFLGAVAVMPNEFNEKALSVFWLFLMVAGLWSRFYRKWLSRKLNLRMPAPPRLQTIVTETAAHMNVSFHKVWLLRSSLAQAYADVRNRDLLFTERLLEIMPDEEVAAICAHELAHLSEPKTEYFKRWFLAASMWPWVFLKPLVHTFGMPAYFGLVGLTVGVQTLRYQVSHKLEVRADRIAKDSVAESAVYARALLRLYEDNQSPAVTSKREKTHPDLYDRMLAAGVTPDFPRPAVPERRAWHSRALGTIFLDSAGHPDSSHGGRGQ